MSTGTPDDKDGGEWAPEPSSDEPAGQWLGTWIDGQQIDPVLPPPPPVQQATGQAPVSPWAPPWHPGHAAQPATRPPAPNTQAPDVTPAAAPSDTAPSDTAPSDAEPSDPTAEIVRPNATHPNPTPSNAGTADETQETARPNAAPPTPERTVAFTGPPRDSLPQASGPGASPRDSAESSAPAPTTRLPTTPPQDTPEPNSPAATTQIPTSPPRDTPTNTAPPAGSPRNLPAANPTVPIDRPSRPAAPSTAVQNTVIQNPAAPNTEAPNPPAPNAPVPYDPGLYDPGPYDTGPNSHDPSRPPAPQQAPPQGTGPQYQPPYQGQPPPVPGQPVRSPWQQYTQAQTGAPAQMGQQGPVGAHNAQAGPPAQRYAQHPATNPGPLPYEPWLVAEPVRGRSRGRMFAVCAGIVVLGLVVAGAVVFLGGGGHAAKKTSGAELAGNLFAADPSATADGRDQELLGVATSGSTVVAVGDESDDIAPRAQFLVSTDGGHSFRLADIQADGGEPPYGDVPQQVAGAKGAWVALGSSPTGTAVWTSSNGTSWTRQPDADGQAFAATDQVNRIVPTSSGFVAVGDSTAGAGPVPVVWRSTDGKHWDRAEPQFGNGSLSLVNAAASGNTIIVHGVGSRPVKKKRPVPVDAIWRSGDGGQTWQAGQVPQPAGSGGVAIAGTASGLFVARNVPGRYAVVLTSADGRQWSEAGKIQLPGYGALLRLTGADNGLAALVTSGQQVLLARSSNGTSWQSAGAVPLPSGRTFQDVTLTSQSTVLVGREMTADTNAVLAVRTAQGQPISINLAGISGAVQPDKAIMGVATASGRTVAVGSTNGHAAAWTSTNGQQWSRAATQGPVFVRPGRQRLLGLTSGGAGWLAIGYNGTTPRRPLVITSADGTAWHAADNGSAFKSNRGTPLATYGAASGPAGYVVVGEDDFSAATWHSTDLSSWRRGTGSSTADLTGTAAAGRWMRGVVGEPSGYVAVGGLNDPTVTTGPQDRPAAWTSTDGQIWTLHQLPLPAGATGGWCDKVAVKNNVLVATGTAATATGSLPFAFVSTNGGSSWQEARLPTTGGPRYSTVSAETTTAGGFVIAGTVGRPGATNVVLWTSANGTAWTLTTPTGTGLSGPGDHKLTGLTMVGSNLLAVGTAADHLGKQPTLWLRPPP